MKGPIGIIKIEIMLKDGDDKRIKLIVVISMPIKVVKSVIFIKEFLSNIISHFWLSYL